MAADEQELVPAIHPGEFVWEDVLVPLKLDVRTAADKMGLRVEYLQGLVEQRESVDQKAAEALGELVGNGRSLWLGIQALYDRWQESQRALPTGEMVILTGDIMREMWPHGDTKIPGLVAGIVAAAPSVFLKYGLTSDLLVAHAMAQFSHECGAGTEVVENLNYSAAGLMNTWPSRFDAAKAAQFAHDQQRIANEVYNGRMGNRLGTDDGWKYRGRGGSQVTGRNGYTELGEKVGLPLIDQPDLVNNPQHFLECAVADFIICNCLPFAAHDDVRGVTFHLNGGFIGLQERTEWLARWKAALAGGAAHGTVWVQQSLNKLGEEPPLKVDGSFGLATVAAVKAFQQAKGLDVDGKVGPQTEVAIEQALPAG